MPILYSVQGKTRSAEIPGIMHMSVDPLPTCTQAAKSGPRLAIPLRRTGSRLL